MAGTFEVRGINHLALVSSDMARTVEFYEGVLGMPLVKTLDLIGGGQHFFFDCGGGDCLAFFWFPDAPAAAPGVASHGQHPNTGIIATAHGSMNHVAFDVPPESIDRYVHALREAGVECTEVANHDDSEIGIADHPHPGVFVRSIYFLDPDGILVEFAAWTRALTSDDVSHAPKTALHAHSASDLSSFDPSEADHEVRGDAADGATVQIGHDGA